MPCGTAGNLRCMCRSIRTLRHQHDPATTGEVEAAARQYVRKVSGFRVPSARNAEAFDEAVAAVTEATRVLLEQVQVRPAKAG